MKHETSLASILIECWEGTVTVSWLIPIAMAATRAARAAKTLTAKVQFVLNNAKGSASNIFHYKNFVNINFLGKFYLKT